MSKKLLPSIVFIGYLLFVTAQTAFAQSDDYVVHTIKHGEVPSVLAKKYNVPLDVLSTLNKWGPKTILHVGDKIKLPASAHLTEAADSAAVVKQPATADDASGRTPSVQSVTIAPALQLKDTTRIIMHTVQKGEVPSVIAKKFNVNIEDLIRLNKWGPKPILHVGDKIKIPATAHTTESSDSIKVVPPAVSPLSKNTTAANDEQLSGTAPPSQIQVSNPVAETTGAAYTVHVLEAGEKPSILAKKYNINVEDLKKLNNWKPNVIWHVGDKVKLPAGAHLTQDAAAAPPSVTAAPPAASVAPVVAPPTTAPAVETGVENNYVVQKGETLYSIGKKYKIPVVKIKNWNKLVDDHITIGQTLLLYTQNPIVQPTADTPPPTAPKTETPQPAITANVPAKQPVASPIVPNASVDTASSNPQGFFTSQFGLNVSGRILQTADGMAMTFKTASGWTDRKYYVLMNDIAPGSIVKITNASDKSVFAKVLWRMGDAKDNEGLNFRVSDAAAKALGLTDPKFPVTITYYK